MNRRDVHRFDRLHQVREVEEQRSRQELVAAHNQLRVASQQRDEARTAAGQLPGNGVRELLAFHQEVAMTEWLAEQVLIADERVRLAEAGVLAAHTQWTLAARRVQGLDKLVARRRETLRAETLLAEAQENQDLFLARRAMGLV